MAKKAKKDPASKAPDGLSELMQAAWRWVDAMAAAGKAPITRPESLKGLDWSWKELGEAISTYRDMAPHDRSEEAVELLREWLEEAESDEAAGALVRSKMSWCFMDSGWEEENEIYVYLWPADAPEIECEALPLPTPMSGGEAQEGVWGLSGGFANHAEALQDAWDQLTEEGFVFDENVQRDPTGTAYAYANEGPEEMWLAAQNAIGALRVKKESAALERSAKKGKPPRSKSGL